MHLNIIEVDQQKIAEIDSDQFVIDEVQDALDIMVEASYHEANSLILYETNLNPAFFELRTKFAGEILLKFTNYRMKLAVVGAFDRYQSNSLQAFIRESNRGKQFFFVSDRETALKSLTQ